MEDIRTRIAAGARLREGSQMLAERMASNYAPVGAVVHDAYWREDYTVLAHNADGSMTIRWHGRFDSLGLDRFPAGRERTHRTPLYPRDTIVSVL